MDHEFVDVFGDGNCVIYQLGNILLYDRHIDGFTGEKQLSKFVRQDLFLYYNELTEEQKKKYFYPPSWDDQSNTISQDLTVKEQSLIIDTREPKEDIEDNILPILFDTWKEYVSKSPKIDYEEYISSETNIIWERSVCNTFAIKLFCLKYKYDLPYIKLEFDEDTRQPVFSMMIFQKSGEDPSTVHFKQKNFETDILKQYKMYYLHIKLIQQIMMERPQQQKQDVDPNVRPRFSTSIKINLFEC